MSFLFTSVTPVAPGLEILASPVAGPPAPIVVPERQEQQHEQQREQQQPDSLFRVGDKVWAKFKKTYFPATIAGVHDLNDKQKKTKLKKGEIFVWWYGEENVSKVKESTLDSLGEEDLDIERANVNTKVRDRYNLAIGKSCV